MISIRSIAFIPLISLLIISIGCAVPSEPDSLAYDGNSRGGDVPPDDPPVLEETQFLKNATFDALLGDLDDPDILAKATRGNLLITDCSRFWGQPGVNEDLARLRAVNPDLKIIGFFRSKTVRLDWDQNNPNTFNKELYEASKPYWSYTTTGDTLQDWPNIANFSPLTSEARQAMREVFVRYQNEAVNKLDGVFWDYFNNSLWISPDVHTMDGEPDLDGDGIVHWDDADEIEAYKASEVACIEEMRAAMGEDFIQIVNGGRALIDSTFANLVDGMFYETFPHVGFNTSTGYAQALDPNHYNNLWAAHEWPRTRNGGPWLLLSNKNANYIYFQDGEPQTLNIGELNRAVALLTGGTALYYDLSGRHEPGYPSVELDLGLATSEVCIEGNVYSREFENGRIELTMESGGLPRPFTYEIIQNDEVVQYYDFPRIFP